MASKSIALVTLAILGGAELLWFAPAKAHGWYPKECCDDRDCAPVESVAQFLPVGGGLPQLIVTSKHGTVIVPQGFPVRQSKDGRMHVCIRQNEFGTWDVMCLFMPPHM